MLDIENTKTSYNKYPEKTSKVLLQGFRETTHMGRDTKDNSNELSH